MIYSKKYNFIFQKTKKTGSTSFEIAVAPFLGSCDVITPVSEQKLFGGVRIFEEHTEEDNRKIVGALPPQNYKAGFATEYFRGVSQLIHYWKSYAKIYFYNFGKVENQKKTVKLKRCYTFHQHMTMQETMNVLMRQDFDRALKLAVIRDPIKQAVSDYYDQLLRPENYKFDSFDQYLDERAEYFFEKCWNKFAVSDKIMVNKFIKYENYDSDISKFCDVVGIPSSGVLKNMKKLRVHSIRNNAIHNYQPSAEQKKIILKSAFKFVELQNSKEYQNLFFN